MGSVDNLVLVYHFEYFERDALELALSLLRDPHTKLTVVMPTRKSLEREIQRRYEGDDSADSSSEQEEEGEQDKQDKICTTEMEEAEDPSSSSSSEEDKYENQDPDDEGATTASDDTSKIEGRDHIPEERAKMRKRKKWKLCPYKVEDFFDIFFLLRLMVRGLIWMVRACLNLCATPNHDTSDTSSITSAEDEGTEMRVEQAPKEADSERPLPAATSRSAALNKLKSWHSVIDISRFALLLSLFRMVSSTQVYIE